MAVAIGAQLTLYLTLRRIAVATMPAWAHGLAHHHQPAPVSTSPSVVGVTVVATPDTIQPDAAPLFPAPPLEPVPLVPVPPPALPSGERPGDQP